MQTKLLVESLVRCSDRWLLVARLLGASTRTGGRDVVARGWIDQLTRSVRPDDAGAADLRATLEALARCVDTDDLPEAYRQTFGHIPAGSFSPYETSYGPTNAFTQAQTLADLNGYYQAFGVEPGAEQGERPDHLGVQCEFLAFLLYKEALAQQQQDIEHIEMCRAARRRFLEEHLGRWAPVLFERLEREAPAEVYRLCGRLGRVTLDAEIAALDARCAVRELHAPPADGVAEDYCPELFACPGTVGDGEFEG